MSLDFYLTEKMPVDIYSFNITHNLAKMASEADLYCALWRPEEIGATKAKDIIESLEKGLNLLEEYPERFKAFNPSNGWGHYDSFLKVVRELLEACRCNPEADIKVSR